MFCVLWLHRVAADDNQTNFEPSEGANTTEEKLWIRILLADGLLIF
jgi:hypothetical protein